MPSESFYTLFTGTITPIRKMRFFPYVTSLLIGLHSTKYGKNCQSIQAIALSKSNLEEKVGSQIGT